jgi:hypothetical protein
LGIRVECDWCRQTIPAGAPYVTVEIDGKISSGHSGSDPVSVSQPARVFCGNDRLLDDDPATHGWQTDAGWGRRESCAKRMLAALEGNPVGRADCGMEWRLVPQAAPHPELLIDAPLDALKLSNRTRAMLEKAGITTVHDLAALTKAQWLAIKGIAGPSAEEIRKALHRHQSADPKTLVAS